MAIDAATVRKVAHLARIKTAEDRLEPLAQELNGILAWIEQLDEVDVDGIEHFILRGARETLSRASLRSILIEVNEDFRELATEVQDLLTSSGFQLSERRHAEMFESSDYSSTYNQIWVRP